MFFIESSYHHNIRKSLLNKTIPLFSVVITYKKKIYNIIIRIDMNTT